MARRDTETTCHCGASYQGSDHCPQCGCEQYESGDCGLTTVRTTVRRVRLPPPPSSPRELVAYAVTVLTVRGQVEAAMAEGYRFTKPVFGVGIHVGEVTYILERR